jgi:hypothetical protein
MSVRRVKCTELQTREIGTRIGAKISGGNVALFMKFVYSPHVHIESSRLNIYLRHRSAARSSGHLGPHIPDASTHN